MTSKRALKRRVRALMRETGLPYTTARSAVVPAPSTSPANGRSEPSAPDPKGVTMREVAVAEVFSMWSDEQRMLWHARGTNPDAVARVRLQERDGGRYLDMYVGVAEARSIQLAQAGVDPGRPLTHDLYAQTLDLLGARVVEARILEQREGVFYAELQLDSPSGATSIEARPSDAINVALRRGAPLFAADMLLISPAEGGDMADQSQ